MRWRITLSCFVLATSTNERDRYIESERKKINYHNFYLLNNNYYDGVLYKKLSRALYIIYYN